MTNTDLLIRLRELHEELASINDDLKSVEQIEEETIDALGDLVTDVCTIVDQANVSSDLQKAHLTSDDGQAAGVQGADLPGVNLLGEDLPSANNLSPDLLDGISDFESSHPRVTRFLSQLTDLLAMMGI